MKKSKIIWSGERDDLGQKIPEIKSNVKKEEKSAYDMTDEEVAKSVDLNVSDFSDDGADLDELRDIMEDK